MTKRKRTVEDLSFWRRNDTYIIPYLPERPSDVMDKLREQNRKAKGLFIKLGTLLALLVELWFPSTFENNQSDYFIVPARELEGPCKGKLGEYDVTWNGRDVLYLGDKICEPCFLSGQISTTRCPKHLADCQITVSENKRCKCTHANCEAAFGDAASLKRHLRTHTGEKPFKCTHENCDAEFAQSGNLQRHIRTHSGEKPFQCTHEECDAAFAESGDLQRHIRTHTGEKPFHCTHEDCEAAFGASGDLQRHLRTHTGEKPFKCTHANCDAAFGDAGILQRHLRTHTGEKPFKCTYENCDDAFARSGILQRHLRTHTGEKPFNCTYEKCDEGFADRGSLQKHVRTHTGEKPYTCEHCGKTFASKSNCRRHMKLHEIQSTYTIVCPFNDSSLEIYKPDSDNVACAIRCKTKRHLEYHIQHHHTEDGIASKYESENKLARFFESKDIPYDRDWANLIQFKTCKNIEGKKMHARPDFFLSTYSAKLNAIVLVGNDEFAHRQYACDFQRVWNIVNALEQTKEFKGVPIVYLRFNPHHFKVGAKFYDRKLTQGHDLLFQTLESLVLDNIRPGVNLIFIQYDQDSDGNLDVFAAKDEPNDYAELYKSCVVKVIY